MMTQNPFSQAGGASTTGASANQNPGARSPNGNTGANSSNTNSGTNPAGNTGNNNINANPANPDLDTLDPNAVKKPLKEGDDGYDPMMDFSKVWETEPVDPDKPKPKKKSYVADIDPKALTESVGKMDFTKNISQEDKAAMLAGGEEGFGAMMRVINAASRQAVATTYQAGNKMVAQALEAAEAGFLEKVPGHVKNQLVDNSLSANPIMADPAYAPLVEATKQQFLGKYPKATASQVNTAVTAYFDDMAAKMTKKPTAAEKTNTDKLRAGDTSADWMDWAATEMGIKK